MLEQVRPGAGGYSDDRAGGRVRSALRVLGLAVVAVLVVGYLAAAQAMLSGRVERQANVTGYRAAAGVSDLFPRWYGARALLAGRSPYGEELTGELQRLAYGRVMAPDEEIAVVGYRMGFFYPPYVVLPLLPVLWLPFDAARWVATAALAAGVAACAVGWARALGGARRAREAAAVAAAALAFYPTLEVLALQQLSGLVLCYLVMAYLAAARGRFFWAGVLLGLAVVKPQLAAVPAAGLFGWALWRRERWPLVAGCGAAVTGQLLVAELLVPNWLPQFLADAAHYKDGNSSLYWVPAMLSGGSVLGTALVGAPPLLILGWCWWRVRALPAASVPVLRTAALGFAVWAAVMPNDTSQYNRTALLIPLVTLWLASTPPDRVGRLATKLAAVSVALPVALMGLLGWIRWLHLALPLDAPVLRMGDSVDAGTTLSLVPLLLLWLLPLLLLPAVIVACRDALRAGHAA